MGFNQFIAQGARVFGQVHLGKQVSIWFNAVLRGDMAAITVDDGANIQDNSVVHVSFETPCHIGKDVTIGHSCIIHGCTIDEGALIGMGSTIMNHAHIGAECLVGSGSLVTQGKVFPPRMLIMGRPAKVVRALTEEEIQANRANAAHYREMAERFLSGEFVEVSAEQ